ncbi:MAG: 2-amino-4-hydroxy-6-hydroxymethyldihydropteridine diphosphokinase [Prevotella sp.]|nr:2-amino-4-hydroxy-6-hydroxymethyldihydropteridine diphosphokinase [Prevotella sp.]
MHCSFSTINPPLGPTGPLHRACLGLGSNLGDRSANLRQAVSLIGEKVGKVERCSSTIDTQPWGFHSEHRFLNACLVVDTPLSPRELLDATQHIEHLMGRTEKSVAGVYHDRIIDIDILLYDNLRIEEPELTIPHPRMLEREFVTRPLRELGILQE